LLIVDCGLWILDKDGGWWDMDIGCRLWIGVNFEY